MKLATICFCVVMTFVVSTGSNVAAFQNYEEGDGRSISTSVNRVVSVAVINKNGRHGAYELSDSTINGETQGDGIIDFANVIKEITKPDRGAESQIPPGTKYPIVVKFNYFHPGDKMSSYSSLSETEWFSGFYGKVTECRDAYGNSIVPVSGEWGVQKASEEFMRGLQQMYNKYR